MPDHPSQNSLKKVTKADIVDAVYEKIKLNRNDIRTTVDLIIEEMKEALARNQSIELRGFGSFEVKIRKARPNARNPRTGEKIITKPHGVVSFRSGRELRQEVWNINEEK